MRAGVFAAAGKPKEAEASHRRAIELDSKAPEAWVGLVYFLARSDRVDDAKAEIAKRRAGRSCRQTGRKHSRRVTN